jgi:hypothetical protein
VALLACGAAASSPAAGASGTAVAAPSVTPGPMATATPYPGAIHLSMSAPATVRAGIGFIVQISTDTPVQLMAPDGRLIPGTGHFHIFIDRPPLPPGSFTPQEADIVHSITRNTRMPALSAGPHTLTATLADGMDRVTDVTPVAASVVAQ